jgi:hypothetical protein
VPRQDPPLSLRVVDTVVDRELGGLLGWLLCALGPVFAHVSSLHRELIWVGLFKFGVLPRLIAQALHPIALNLRTVPALHIAAASLGWVMTTRFTSIPVYVAYDAHL